MTEENNPKNLLCSFCGKQQHEVKKLIAGPAVFICNECVTLCVDIVKEGNKKAIVNKDGTKSIPQDIIKILNEKHFKIFKKKSEKKHRMLNYS